MRTTLLFAVAVLLSPISPAVADHCTVMLDGSGDYTRIISAVTQTADGDTILLGDGVYDGAGNRDIDLTGRDLVIRSLSDDMDACIIDCEDAGVPHRGFLIQGGDVAIGGLTVRNGEAAEGGGALIVAGTPRFTSVRFQENHATSKGGGVYLEPGASGYFVGCRFDQNTADADAGAAYLATANPAGFSDCIFNANEAVGCGGAVWERASPAEFVSCRFFRNEAGAAGGALYCTATTSPYLESCSFFLNRTTGDGGAVCCGIDSRPEFSDVGFVRNFANGQGAALVVGTNAYPVLDGCSLVMNTTTGAGAIHCQFGATPTLDRCLIAWSQMSAAVTGDTDDLTITCSDIFGNDQGDWVNGLEGLLGLDGNIHADPMLCDPTDEYPYLAAGSPCLPASSPCGIIGCQAQGCDHPTYYLDGYAGAFLETIQEAINLAPTGATILLMRDSYGGPGNRDLDCLGKDLVIKPDLPGDVVVIDCEGTAGDPHRGFAFWSGETASARLERLTIRNGYAPPDDNYWISGTGGGVLCYGASPSLVDCRFESCRASTAGAGVYVYGACAPTITGCVFAENTCQGAGGGLASNLGSPAITDCQFLLNSGWPGSGLYLAGGQTSAVTGCLFDGNSCEETDPGRGGGLHLLGIEAPITIADCTFRNNISQHGGAVDLLASEAAPMDVSLVDCSLHDNATLAYGHGGGLHASGQMTVHLDHVTISANSAPRGGGIYVTDAAGLEAHALDLVGNEAADSGAGSQAAGAGIYQDFTAAGVSLVECDIEGNHSDATGGSSGAGLFVTGSVSLVGVDVHHNTLAGNAVGAGIFVASTSSVDVTGGAIFRNEASGNGYGGGVYVNGGTFWMEGGHVAENSAVEGGGLWLEAGSSVFLDGATFYGNAAVDHGGALFCRGSAPEASGCTFVDNGAGAGGHAALFDGSAVAFNSCILAHGNHGGAVFVAADGGDPVFHCTDIFGNAGGDWTPPFADDLLADGNLNVDPFFCDWPAHDFTLAANSPCLPAGNDCAHQLGAWGEGCSATPVAELPPAVVALGTVYPNPFNPLARISFTLPAAMHAKIQVFDAAGRLQAVLLDAPQPAGVHATEFRAEELPSGVYFCRLDAGGVQLTRKMTLLK